jgi:succinate dehydrogenase / fumarate reductase membrane anchor subunit
MAEKIVSLQTDIARARGLGASGTGTEHWWHQRMTSVALIPLSLWFVASMFKVAGAGHAAVKAWLSGPVSATLAILFIAITFHHTAAGLEVIIEDYVHTKWVKLVVLFVEKALCAIAATVSILSVLKIALGG